MRAEHCSLLLLAVVVSVVMAAGLGAGMSAAPAYAAADRYPTSFALPDGFQPEGIAIGGRRAYFGSRVDGDIYRVDLATGRGEVFTTS